MSGETPQSDAEIENPPLGRTMGSVIRGSIWVAGTFLFLSALVVAGLAFYTTTRDFENRVAKEVVRVLENATGGRVELGHIAFNLWHLSIEADGLVIHGLEGPGEAPYLSADKILIGVKIVSFVQRTLHAGVASHVGVNLLRIESPHVHLIIDNEGRTNQPVPKHPTQSGTPLQDTLLDLKANQVDLVHGIALVNDRAIPFNFSAQDLNASVRYIPSTDRYGATVDLRNLQTQMAKEPEIKSSLHIEVEMGRDVVALKTFDFHSGEHSELQASALLNDFASPKWQAKLVGSVEFKQLQLLAGVDGLEAGTLELNVAGHNCYVAPVIAQKRPKRFEHLSSKREAEQTAAKTLLPDPECQTGYLLVGSLKTHGAAYVNQYVRVRDVNASAQLKVTPSQLLFTALTGTLATGGSATGQLKIDNWLGEVPQNTEKMSPTVVGAVTTANKTSVAVTGKQAVSTVAAVTNVGSAHAYLTVLADHIPLRTIMLYTAPKDYGDLGFDTSLNGPVKVEWGGPATDIADTVVVNADLTMVPLGSRRGVDIPVTGRIQGGYDGTHEVVNITSLTLATPKSTLDANGVLGVNIGDRLTALNLNLNVHDLAEYDRLLTTIGLEGNGKKGAKAIPITLHGSAAFQGTARGELARLDVKGHLQADNLDVRIGDLQTIPTPAVAPAPGNLLAVAMTANNPTRLVAAAPPTDVHIDSLLAEAEYTPAGLAVGSSTITQGSAVLHLAGTFKPRTLYKKRMATYVWDDGTVIDVSVQLGNANVVDVLTIAGQQKQVPVTGTISINAHAAGAIRALGGAGTLSLVNGSAYGEPYDAVKVDLGIKGQDIEASQFAVRMSGMSLTGNGGYDLDSKLLHGHIQGNDLRLSKFKTVQNTNLNVDGVVSLVADASGTVERPGLKANIKVVDMAVQGKTLGDASLDAHSVGNLVSYSLRSNLVGAQVVADGQTDLTGDYLTKATVTIAGLKIQKPLALFSPGGPAATSSEIAGTITVSGPARTPVALAGQATFNAFSVTVQGITLQSAGPLSIGLHNGLATLDAFHILGQDTDIRASGNAQVFGATDASTGQPSLRAGKLNLQALGSINVAIAHTLDPEFMTSGKVTFAIGAGGLIANPALTGKVQFLNVNVALDGIPNGLSNMNGTLVFNENRLIVEELTATTGGGLLKMGGFLAYRNGIYADLTAEGDAVRVRVYGLSATANTSLRLQGNPQRLLLSGNVLLTRFGIGPDVDFAAFAGSGGVSAPPDPSVASNKIRMDVHVTSSPQLDFQNSYAKLAGTVDLTVRGTIAEPSVLGRIQITDGSATFAGTKYQLQRGNVYFSNPVRIDPTIDLDATARVETYDVTVGLHGTAANLKPTYRSEPPLTEADIFSLLALGRTQEEAQISQEQQTAAGNDPTTSALLGGALNATVSSRVSKLFGGATVKIDPAFVGTLGGSSARITVQQQLTQQITFTYATNVNYSAQQLIQVAYQLTPNTSVVATRDETGVFSVVYKVRRRYK